MENIKYVARELKEAFLSNGHLRVVAYFVSNAVVTGGVVTGNDVPFYVADFSSLFGEIPFGKRRKGFIIEDGAACYKLQCFDSYDECKRYVDELNQKLLESSRLVLGNDRAVLKRHIKDVEYAGKFEKYFVKNKGELQFGEE